MIERKNERKRIKHDVEEMIEKKQEKTYNVSKGFLIEGMMKGKRGRKRK